MPKIALPANPRFRLNLLLVSILLCWYALSHVWTQYVSQTPGIDYYQFWIVAQAQRAQHPANIYSRRGNDDLSAWARTMVPPSMGRPARLFTAVNFWNASPQINTVATPFLYAAVGGLAYHHHGPWMNRYDHDLEVYHAVGMACAAGAIVALCLSLEYSFSAALLAVAAVFFWCRPLIVDTIVGNVAQLQLAALALFIMTRIKPSLAMDIAGGAILGLLTAFKPTLMFVPLFLGIAWLFDRQWKTLLVQCACGCAALVIAYVSGCMFLHSWRAWGDWLAVLPTLENRLVNDGNYALSRVLWELGGPNISAYLICAVIALIAMVLWKTRARETAPDRFRREYLITGIGAAAAIVALPVAWLHYYLLLLPLLIFMFSPKIITLGGWSGRAEYAVAVMVLLCLFNDPIRWLLELHNPYLIAGLFICSAWELLFLTLAHLERLALFHPSAQPPDLALAGAKF